MVTEGNPLILKPKHTINPVLEFLLPATMK